MRACLLYKAPLILKQEIFNKLKVNQDELREMQNLGQCLRFVNLFEGHPLEESCGGSVELAGQSLV